MERRFLNIYTLQSLIGHSISPVSMTVPALQLATPPFAVSWIHHSHFPSPLPSSNLICSDIVSLRSEDDHFSRFEVHFLSNQISHQILKSSVNHSIHQHLANDPQFKTPIINIPAGRAFPASSPRIRPSPVINIHFTYFNIEYSVPLNIVPCPLHLWSRPHCREDDPDSAITFSQFTVRKTTKRAS